MAGIPFDKVRLIIDAHAKNDEERFRRGVLQIAAGLSHDGRKRMLEELISAGQASKLVQLPRQLDHGIVDEAPKVHDVVLDLPDHLITELDLIHNEWDARSRLLSHGIRPRARFLFHGPPGNGKSTKAIQLGRELGLNTFMLSLPGTVTSMRGEPAANLRRAFELLRGGHALVIDEIDAISDTRQASKGQGAMVDHNHTVATFLTLLDKERNGLLIATTNRLDMLDPALVRRFDDCLPFPEPSERALGEFIAQRCKGFGLEQAHWPSPPHERSFDAAYKAVLREVRYAICHGNLKAQGDPPCLKANESAQPSPNI